jgi:ATP-dependent Clp protease protease subunit
MTEILHGPSDDAVITIPADSARTSSKLNDRGIYFLCGGFNNDSARSVVTWILESNFAHDRDYDHLTLIINSPGGSVPAAFSIIDAMNGSRLPVHTVGIGMVGSCGLLTFMNGKKGHRLLTPNTSILSHQWSWGAFGKEHELVAVVKEYDLTTRRMLAHHRKCTGLSDDMIKEKLLPPQDIWLSAEEAKILGLCDSIADFK